MRKHESVSLALLLFISLSGCSSIARKVLIRPGQGGVVAIPDSEARRGRAESIMSEVCSGKKPRVTEEREIPVATVVQKTTQKDSSLALTAGDPKMSGNDSKSSREEHFSTQNEWQITFQCE